MLRSVILFPRQDEYSTLWFLLASENAKGEGVYVYL
nr:MAG TPA: hypothetical protein [Caudoviricetes sp.]